MIPTVWPVALNSPRLQLFHRLINPDKIHTHIITSEYPRSIEEARTLLGRVVGDRSVGRLVFGTRDTKAKMKVLALSSRTDVVADDFEVALNEVIGELSEEERRLVNPSPMTQNKDAHNNGGCPVKHHDMPSSTKKNDIKMTILGSRPQVIRRAALLNRQDLFDIVISSEGSIHHDSYPSHDVYARNHRGHS